MTRTRTHNKSYTTSTTSLERQSKRLSRQQKQLDRELVNQMGQNFPAVLTGAKGRGIRLSDIKRIEPLTDSQTDFFHAYEDGENAIVMMGSAGVGKTFLAVYKALEEILQPEPSYDKVVLVRSLLSGRDVGHLPGSLEEKGEIYELPFKEVVNDILGKQDAYTKLKESGKIEFHSSSFLRGLTFNKSIIIIDEAQNFTWQELSTAITRFGRDSKIIICCDYAQNDLVQKKSDVSGLRTFIEVTQKMEEFVHIKFTTADIIRSGLVKSFLIQCERLGL